MRFPFACFIAMFAAANSAHAVSTLPLYEPFPISYGNGTLMGSPSTTNVWDVGNTGTSLGAVVTNNAALSSSALSPGSGYGLFFTGSPGSTRNRGATFTAQTFSATSSNLYASFLLQVDALPTDPRLIAAFSTTASGTTASGVMGVWLNSAGQILLSKNSSTTPSATNATPLPAGTNLIVLRYQWANGTGNDEVAVWLNPGNSGAAENAVPTAHASTTSGTDQATLQSFWVFHPTTTTMAATYRMDEIRVGTNWAQVTPPGESQPPGPTPIPVITNAQLAANAIILRGTNGPASAIYQVLAHTNLTQPVSNWPSIGASTFDANGNFASTSAVPAGLSQQYFRLFVGGSLPQLPFAPVISNSPQNLTLIAGQSGQFNVVAGGTAPLSYFWVFNGTTPVGGNSATLPLNAVTTNDAGAYAVIVSNSVGTATSAVATLTVLLPPAIVESPTNLSVLAGQPASFNVAATGSAPLRYQWFFNSTTPLANATNATFSLASAALADAGNYSVRVTNIAGSVTSSVATLTVFSAPTITTNPQSQSVSVSNTVQFIAGASGTAPLAWQWFFNTNSAIANATNATLTLTNVQLANAGAYFARATNSYGATTSAVATLTVTTNQSFALYNLYGFGAPTTGGGVLPDTHANYRKVFNAGDLRLALASSTVKVIEIMNDLNLGWNEVGATNQTGAFRQSTAASLHPALIASGITTVDIQDKNGLTIFSANGATLRHVEFNVKRTHNVLIRNLKFDELWEWDELTKGDYDSKDWDFITIGDGGNCTNVWVDHCTFTKAYDGVVDLKGGDNRVTISWCKFIADDGGPGSFVRQQIQHLETNGTSEAMFDFLRANGFSIEDIIAISRSQKKGHLVGATEFAAANADLKLTLHHNYYQDMQDRHPRLRAGNSHVYNIFINNTNARAAKLLRNTRVAAMTPSEALKLSNGTYKFDVTLNGAISTEDGAVLVEKCHIVDVTSPLRNNQTDPNNPDYTGKIRAEDTIYSLDGSFFRGNSEDIGSPLAPVPATLKPFSWNGFVTLPYTYVLDDPASLAGQLGAGGAAVGAGTLNWAKTNWLNTSY